MNKITIQSVNLPIIEIRDQRCLTLAMVDRVHRRPEGTARKRFNDHKSRFIDGEDYFVRNSDEARQMGITAPNGLILLTESGYLMLVKSFTDDLAWEVQRKLVNHYFRTQANIIDLNQALSDPAKLRSALLEYTEKVIALEAKVAEQAPKAAFHDAVASATNCQSIQEIAKVLKTGPNRLFQFLREQGLLMRNNLPYQQYLDAGYFRVVEKEYKDQQTGERRTYVQTRVTGKGLAFIQRRLSGQQNLPLKAG